MREPTVFNIFSCFYLQLETEKAGSGSKLKVFFVSYDHNYVFIIPVS